MKTAPRRFSAVRRILYFAAALALLLPASSAQAGIQGRLTGKITDAAGDPVEGVTVTITTTAINNFKLSQKSDKDGRYSAIVNDATIMYHIRFDKEGYVSVEADRKLSTVEVTKLDQKLNKAGGGGGAAPGASKPAAPAAPSANDKAAQAFNAAVDLLNSGDKAAADAKLQEAVALNADLPQAWQALTSLAYERKDWPKVIEYGQKATDLDPTANLYGMMADAATQTGDKKSAAEFRKKFDEAHPDSPELLYNKGIEAYNHKKSKEAEGFLEKAVAAKPDFALAHYYLALAAMNNKKNAVAREHLEKYLELDPNGSEAATAKELLPLVK
jgi:tetratricopeptide (TPR) repeat protein